MHLLCDVPRVLVVGSLFCFLSKRSSTTFPHVALSILTHDVRVLRFYSEDAPLHVLPSGVALDPLTELTAQVVSVVTGDYDGSSMVSTTQSVAEGTFDVESTDIVADGDAKIDTQLLKAMNEHVSLRFIKAGGAATLKRVSSATLDVIIFFQPMSRDEPSSSHDDRSAGSTNGAFVFLLDMSLPRALEKVLSVQLAAEAAAEAKSRHIAFMSHEIRNPVNGILASVEAIDEMLPILQMHRSGMGLTGQANEEAESHIGEVEDLVRTTLACTDQLRRTVDDILDLNKLEEGKLTLCNSSFSVEKMLRSVSMQVKSAARVKGLKLLTKMSPILQTVNLVGDVGRIQQVLTNFCWNAIKFTSKGSITTEVLCEVPEGGIAIRKLRVPQQPAQPSRVGTIADDDGVDDVYCDDDDDEPGQKITVYFKVGLEPCPPARCELVTKQALQLYLLEAS